MSGPPTREDTVGEHYRDYRNDRNEQRARRDAQNLRHDQPPPRQRCYDWIITSGQHYARDRASFSEYKPIICEVPGIMGSIKVAGIGIVVLNVLKEPGSPLSGNLILKDVLHIPAAHCNGVSERPLTNNNMNYSRHLGLTQFRHDHSGQPICYGKRFGGLLVARLELAGNPQGDSPLSALSGQPIDSLSALVDETVIRDIKYRAANVSIEHPYREMNS